MLWSLLKIVIFICIVVALTIGANYLLGLNEGVLITVAGREYSLTPLVVVVLGLFLLLAVFVILRVAGLLVATLRFLNGDETAISRYFNRRSEKRGYEALGEGMMALAAGEGRLAIRKARRAESLLNRPELTNLVIAQGAEMVGDKALATETLKEMVKEDRTRFLGVRGLVRQKLEEGDTDTAMKLAERALAIRPQNAEIQDTLLDLQTRDEDWQGARTTLAAKVRSGTMPRDVHRRRDAVLALAHARDALAEGKIELARTEAAEANRLSPDLVPAATMAARMAIESGRPKVAARIVRKAWDVAPHPDLAAAFAEIAPDETPKARLTRFRQLLAKHPDAEETKLLHAELLIAAEDFAQARTVLGDLPQTEPDARNLMLMAAIERGEGAEDRVVRAWLAKAVTAPRGAQWVCEVDGKAYPEWQPITDGGFDTLSWKKVPAAEVFSGATSGMLPLIVGALEDQRSEPTTDDAKEVTVTAPASEAVVLDKSETPSEPEPEAERT